MLLGLPKFDHIFCKTTEEACSFLARYQGEAMVLAGGTDLLVKMKHKKMLPAYLINIKRIPDLSYIHYDEQTGVRIGALTTIQTLRNSPLLMKKFSVLNQAAGVLGTAHVRNLATLGGNLCNASPASECAAPLLTLEARAKLVGAAGERMVPLEEFFLQPGKSVLRGDEILTEVQIPNLPPHAVGVHIKYGTRRVDVAIVGMSLVMVIEGDECREARIALGAVAPTPIRARKAENVLKGQKLSGVVEDLLEQVARTAADESFPISDLRGTADYRRDLVMNLVRQGMERAIAQARC
jgi:CO/xanthine dehydrogenase FAD-binding subunit